MKRSLLVITALFFGLSLMVGFGPAPVQAETTFVTIGTGGVTGVYYPTGGAEAIDVALKILAGEEVPKEITLGSRVFMFLSGERARRGGEWTRVGREGVANPIQQPGAAQEQEHHAARQADGRDDREAVVPVPAVLDWRLAFGRPGAAHHRLEHRVYLFSFGFINPGLASQHSLSHHGEGEWTG